ILHVSDASDPRHAELDVEVDRILRELGVDDRPRLRVFNKMDLLTEEQKAALAHPYASGAAVEGGPVVVSAKTGDGIEEPPRRVLARRTWPPGFRWVCRGQRGARLP